MSNEREQRIQEEIRRRILAASRKEETRKSHLEETRATLDALEDIVDLPREEMERIAGEVESEYKTKGPPGEIRESRRTNRLRNLIPIVLGVTAIMLFRNGSSLYLLFGATAIVSLFVGKRKNG